MTYDLSCGNDFLKVFLLGLLDVGSGLAFSGGQDFLSLSSSSFLDLSLQLLLWLSLGVPLGEDSESSQSVVGFVLDQVFMAVINEDESSRSVTTESSSESEENDILDVPFELGRQELLKFSSGDVGLSLVEDFQNDFFSGQQLVHAKLLGSNGDGHGYNKFNYLLFS